MKRIIAACMVFVWLQGLLLAPARASAPEIPGTAYDDTVLTVTDFSAERCTFEPGYPDDEVGEAYKISYLAGQNGSALTADFTPSADVTYLLSCRIKPVLGTLRPKIVLGTLASEGEKFSPDGGWHLITLPCRSDGGDGVRLTFTEGIQSDDVLFYLKDLKLTERYIPFTDDGGYTDIINTGIRDFSDGRQGVKSDSSDTSANCDVEWTADEGVGETKGALRITARQDVMSAQPYMVVKLRPNRRYRLSFDARTASGTNSLQAILLYPEGNVPYTFPITASITESWQTFSAETVYTGDSTQDHCSLIFRLSQLGEDGTFTYYLDNINLIALDEPDAYDKLQASGSMSPLKKENTIPGFVDCKNHPLRDSIEYLFARGAVSDAQRFEPDRGITVPELVKMVAAALGIEPASYRGLYEGISRDHWSAPYLQGAFDAGLLGAENITADGVAEKELVAALLLRAAAYREAGRNPYDQPFLLQPQASAEAVYQAEEMGLSVPDSPTRAQAAELLFTFLEQEEQTVFYVDPAGDDQNPGTKAQPFATIAHARDVVREKSYTMQHDLYIYINEGVYYQPETLVFGRNDSGKNGYSVIYKAPVGQTPVISGGKPVTGWSLADGEKNIYSAPADGIKTRQLFVNGKRAVRARMAGGPAGEVLQPAYGHTTTDLSFLTFARPQDLEISYTSVWVHQRCKVQSIEQEGELAKLIMDPVTWGQICSPGSQTSVTRIAFIENAYELLDEPGEWYLDEGKDRFYYIPRDGEDMTQIDAVASVLEELMRVSGTYAEAPIRNLLFDGLTFAHTTWLRPNEKGHVVIQNNVICDVARGEEHMLPQAAVNVKSARNVTFARCTFEKLGSNGLHLTQGAQFCPVIGNSFTDISGGAIFVGDVNMWPHNMLATGDTAVRANHVTNNRIDRIGVEFYSASAISAGYPPDMNIRNNEITNVPYSGIHLGYGWSTAEETALSNVSVDRNYICDTMLMLRDGGGIYTLGRTGGEAVSFTGEGEDKVIAAVRGGSYIRENYLKNQWNHSGVIYNDEGSNYWLVEGNVIDQTEPDSMVTDTSEITCWYLSNGTSTESNTVSGNYSTNARWVTQGRWGNYQQAEQFSAAKPPEEVTAVLEAAGVTEPWRR